jgi:hypothetical protein
LRIYTANVVKNPKSPGPLPLVNIQPVIIDLNDSDDEWEEIEEEAEAEAVETESMAEVDVADFLEV